VPGTDDFAQHLGRHVGIAAELISKIAAVNDGVAPTFQFALHVVPYAVGISGVIGDGTDFELDWGGHPARRVLTTAYGPAQPIRGFSPGVARVGGAPSDRPFRPVGPYNDAPKAVGPTQGAW
jgi:hypothetical protein